MKGDITHQIQYFLAGHLIKNFHIFEIFDK